MLGALLPLAFAPFSLWPLAILIPALLLWLVRDESSARVLFLQGWLFGLGYFGFGVYWVYNSLHVFGQAPPLVASAITALLVVYLALAPALSLLVWHVARRRFGARSLWLLPLIWFAFEWLRGWFLTGMPWLALGYSQTAAPLGGYAPLIGVYGIGALCMLLAVTLYFIVAERRYLLIAPLALLPAAGPALERIDWTETSGEPLSVALIQGNIPQEIKWRYDQRQNIFNTYWRETSRHWERDLIVWPETALPGRSEEIDATLLAPMQEMAQRQQSALMTGLVGSDTARGEFYNSVVLLGAERVFYHKRHLVIFGEYYPMRWLLDLLSGFISIPYSDLTPGPDEQPPMRVRGQTIGMSICFEDAFSREILRALPAANLLVNLTNDAWFGDSTAPHQHLEIARMRARESERPLLRAANTGVSAFIDRKGRIALASAQFATESIAAEVQGRSGVTPFYHFARIQGYLAAGLLIGILIAARRPVA